MKIGVASDSGGDVEALGRAMDLLQHTLGCGRIFFLGGNYVDVQAWQEASAAPEPPPPDDGGLLGAMAALLAPGDVAPARETPEGPAVVRVCERNGPSPEDQKHFDMLGTHLCLLVHNKGDLTRDDIQNAPVILHGRTPRAAVVRIGTRAFITPGQVAGVPDPSVAVLEPAGSALSVTFHALNGRVLHQESVPMGGATRFSLK